MVAGKGGNIRVNSCRAGNVADVAYLVGFTNLSYFSNFSKCFRAQFGHAPFGTRDEPDVGSGVYFVKSSTTCRNMGEGTSVLWPVGVSRPDCGSTR